MTPAAATPPASVPSPPGPLTVVVLAAGEGTRMRSSTPKVLHEVGGRPLLGHVLAAARSLDPDRVVVVVGHARERVGAYVEQADPGAQVVVQEQQLGTGHAVRLALEAAGIHEGTVLVVAGDVPLLAAETLRGLLAVHGGAVITDDDGRTNAATVLSARLADPTGYGRIIRDPNDGSVQKIVEQRDARASEALVDEVNSGTFAFDTALLRDALPRVGADNAAGEEYLTDVVALLREDDQPVGAVLAVDPDEIQGVNDQVQLAEVRRAMRDRIVRAWLRAGVVIHDPQTTWIDVDVQLEPEVHVLPNTLLHGATTVARGAKVGPNSTLTDTTVGAGASVVDTTAIDAVIGDEATVGPYTYLRPGTVLGRAAKAGGFVEMKNARLGEGTKVPHLSYVGDAEIGDGTNIGAATVFVNYDGKDKHRTVIGDHVRVGSDSMLVAPVEIGDGAYTAAGSVITEDVPPGAMAVARARQRNVEGWVPRKRPGSASAGAAERALAAKDGSAGGDAGGRESMSPPDRQGPGPTEEQRP